MEKLFNCLIVDDESLARETLRLLIKKHCSHFKIIGEAWDKDSILSSFSNLEIDVVFLDIQLGELTVFEIINLEDVQKFEVIFTTAYSDYAMKGYELSPLDYVLKPITKEQLLRVEKKLLYRYKENREKKILPSSGLSQKLVQPSKLKIFDRIGMHLLVIQNIMYCIGEGSYTNFYLNDGSKYLVSKNLKIYEDKLTDQKFFRINKSCLINFDHIKSINKSEGSAVIMSDGKSIILSKRKKHQLLESIDRMTL